MVMQKDMAEGKAEEKKLRRISSRFCCRGLKARVVAILTSVKVCVCVHKSECRSGLVFVPLGLVSKLPAMVSLELNRTAKQGTKLQSWLLAWSPVKQNTILYQ